MICDAENLFKCILTVCISYLEKRCLSLCCCNGSTVNWGLFKPRAYPVIIYGCESWTIKKTEGQSIDAFELWCWRRLLRAPWTSGRSNQSILKEISLEYSLEGLMLKLQYFGHLMPRADTLEKTSMLGKTEGRRRRGNRGWDSWVASPTQWTLVWVDSGSWRWTGSPVVLQSMGSLRVRHDWATELNGDADIENRFIDKAGGRKERVSQMERVTWTHIYYHI